MFLAAREGEWLGMRGGGEVGRMGNERCRERRRGSVGGGDIKDEWKSDPTSFRQSRQWGSETKETRSAM